MKGQSEWALLFKIGGFAALLAGVLFRRNIGAEVSLFIGEASIPTTTAHWFSLLQENPLIAFSLLAGFDLVNYLLVGIIMLALAAAFWQSNKSVTLLALVSGLIGITLNLGANISLSMLSLSQRYAMASSEAQKTGLLAAGEVLLAGNDSQATGPLISLMLVALAGLLLSLMMLRSYRGTAIIGLLASGCDLLYCLVFPLTPLAPVYLLLAAAGLFWMIWHFLVARVLLKLAKEASRT
jgi:hypothetical protein